jgi:cell division control protein 45
VTDAIIKYYHFQVSTNMVYLPPPHLAGNRPSYLEAYKNILTSHRRSPMSSASSVIMLVAPNVDALCASQMFARLFKLDDVMYHIIPVSGLNEFEERTNELRQNTAVGIFQPCPLVVLIMFNNSCIRYY